jgi:two-component system aerobic respiration control sensor histidine kinase ArcB
MALILVIDDLKSIRNLLATVLKDLGHEVKLAEDGQKGIELLEGLRAFDLVITDINMPNKNGNEVARYIRKSHISSTPVVAITAFPEEADLELFDFKITKPFMLEELREAVARFTKGSFQSGMSFSESR